MSPACTGRLEHSGRMGWMDSTTPGKVRAEPGGVKRPSQGLQGRAGTPLPAAMLPRGVRRRRARSGSAPRRQGRTRRTERFQFLPWDKDNTFKANDYPVWPDGMDENVLARRYFWPGCHNMEPYRSYYPHAGLVLPNTNRIAERVVVLPTGTSLHLDDIRAIASVLRVLASSRTA